jgi:hypothetical protein
MDSDVQQYLANLIDAARDVVGDNLIAAYAAGSIAMDAYQPDRSDVDVVLICEDPVSLEQKRRLVSTLRHEVLPCPARGLELVVYRRSVAQSGTPEPGFEVELNTGSRMPFRATYSGEDRPAADGRFWYGLDRSILHQSGHRLIGPPAADMFTDLAPDHLHALLVDALTWWLAQPMPADDGPASGAEDAVLGACRSLVKFRYGMWLSKVAAGRWLLDQGPSPLIERSIKARYGGAPPTGSEARAFQLKVLNEISAHIDGSSLLG